MTPAPPSSALNAWLARPSGSIREISAVTGMRPAGDQVHRSLEVHPVIEARADKRELAPEDPVQADLARYGVDGDLDEPAPDGQRIHGGRHAGGGP